MQTIFNERMDTKKLRQKILDLAIHGKLVPQDPNDEPASVLLERIRAEKERLIKEGKIKRTKKSAKSSDTPHYENEVPFEVPEGWVWVRLDSIGDIVTGSTPPKDNKEFYGGDIPFYKPTDLEQGINTTTSTDSLTEEGFAVARQLPTDSILVTCIGATIGKTGMIRKAGTCNQQINAIVSFPNVFPNYIYYVCISDFMQSNIKDNASATTLPILNKNHFAELQIPLPPIEEQKRIVAAIEKWCSLIDTLETLKVELHTYITQTKSKILNLAIHGKLVPQDPNDEPAIELLKRINPKFTPCDNAHYENVPSNWALARVEDIGQLLSGRDLTNDECNSENIGLPYLIGASNIEGNTFSFIRWTEKPQVISQIGDILISCKGTIGAIVKNDIGDIHIARQFMAIRPNTDGITSDYLHICMIAVVEEIKKDARGVIPGIARDDILTKVFAIPPINEQRRIIAAINQYHSILDNISANL